MFTIPAGTEAVFFDLNGTLVHDGAFHHQAFQSLFTEQGIVVTPEEYEAKVANHINTEIWPAVLGRDVSPAEIDSLSREKEKRYLQILENEGVVTPGAAALLATLQRAGMQTVLVTTASKSVVERILEILGLEDAFTHTITGSDVRRGKPDPEIYLLALDQCEVMAEKAVAFEDSPQGVTAAVAAGIPTVGVLPEYEEHILRARGANAIIPDFTTVTVLS